MPRLFQPPEALVGKRITLTGDDHQYLVRVLRLRKGDTVSIFDGRGIERDGIITAISRRETVVSLGDSTIRKSAFAPVMLLQGLARGERMDLVVQKGTELGVTHIIPYEGVRSTVRRERLGHKPERWRTIAQQASAQCQRADVPEIAPPASFAEAIQRASKPPFETARWYLAHEEHAEQAPSLLSVLLAAPKGAPPGGTVIAIGPEGGMAPEESELATAQGFKIVSLGPHILRTETAALAALSLISAVDSMRAAGNRTDKLETEPNLQET